MSYAEDILTPCAVVSVPKMDKNISMMARKCESLGVKLRPHAKTAKSVDISRKQINYGANGITVSTLKEAEDFFAGGINDILYAIGIVEQKLPRVQALMAKGCDIKICTDNVRGAQAISHFGQNNNITFNVFIEIDTDGHRAGISPDSPLLLDIATALSFPTPDGAPADGGALLVGVFTHAGESYYLDTPEALEAMAEQERAECVRAAERLRSAGFSCPVVSTGSTPTAMACTNADQVGEMRPGVYVFMDLVMHNIGVCSIDDIALSVVTSVIGHQPEKGWVLVDAGWMAMSRDRGIETHKRDFGYGLVCSLEGTPVDALDFASANQETGILTAKKNSDGSEQDIVNKYPVGMRFRILPNHACATAAAFSEYYMQEEDGSISGKCGRINGW